MKNIPCSGNPLARDYSRREFLYVGMLGGLGLTLPQFLRMEAQGAQKFYETREGVAKSVINIFLPGGAAHQETFDPKYLAPTEYRGPLGTVNTAIKGEKFSQHMAHMAKIADKITVIRSMAHGEAAHERGTHNMFTGYRPSPALEYPSIGSVVSHLETIPVARTSKSATSACPMASMRSVSIGDALSSIRSTITSSPSNNLTPLNPWTHSISTPTR